MDTDPASIGAADWRSAVKAIVPPLAAVVVVIARRRVAAIPESVDEQVSRTLALAELRASGVKTTDRWIAQRSPRGSTFSLETSRGTGRSLRNPKVEPEDAIELRIEPGQRLATRRLRNYRAQLSSPEWQSDMNAAAARMADAALDAGQTEEMLDAALIEFSAAPSPSRGAIHDRLRALTHQAERARRECGLGTQPLAGIRLIETALILMPQMRLTPAGEERFVPDAHRELGRLARTERRPFPRWPSKAGSLALGLLTWAGRKGFAAELEHFAAAALNEAKQLLNEALDAGGTLDDFYWELYGVTALLEEAWMHNGFLASAASPLSAARRGEYVRIAKVCEELYVRVTVALELDETRMVDAFQPPWQRVPERERITFELAELRRAAARGRFAGKAKLAEFTDHMYLFPRWFGTQLLPDGEIGGDPRLHRYRELMRSRRPTESAYVT